MQKDIENKQDIEFLLHSFYNVVRKNEIIGYIFDEIIKVNWEQHLPLITNFWETLLFGKDTFKGNPMLTHIQISKKVPLTKLHFDTWLQIWNNTINEYFFGKKAEEAKQKAQNIANLMLYKIEKNV